MCTEDILVSVVIPTFERDTFFLSRAVMSILNQTHKNVEVIVVDDSPYAYEGRVEIARYMHSICSMYSNVTYIQNERSIGGALARNRGIELCHGEFITFLDDDDAYKPQKIEKQLRFMQSENCDMSFTNMFIYNSAGRIVDVRSYDGIPSFENKDLLRYHLTRKITGTPTFMYRAEKLREIGGFDDAKLGQEFYLMLKSIEKGLCIRYFNDCDVIVFKHFSGGISQGKNKIEGENAVFRSIRKRFNCLSVRERMFATFRHWAVMAVAYKRNKMFVRVMIAGVLAVVSSPIDFFIEVKRYFAKIANAKKSSDIDEGVKKKDEFV